MSLQTSSSQQQQQQQQPSSPSSRPYYQTSPHLGSPTTPTHADHSKRARSLEEVRGWGDQQIADWLCQLNLARFTSRFKEHKITGAVILDLDNESLKAMEISPVGERVRLSVAVKSLRQECYTSSYASLRPKQGIPEIYYHNSSSPPQQHQHQQHGYYHSPSQQRGDYRTMNQSTISVPTISSPQADSPSRHEGFNVTTPSDKSPGKTSDSKGLLNRSNSFSRFLGRSDSKKSRAAAAAAAAAAANASTSTSSSTTNAPQDSHPLLPPSPRTVQKRTSFEGGIMSMEKVKQTCVKVFGEDGQTRIVNVHNTTSAKVVMGKVLHKFGIDESNADRYCIFVGSSTNGEARALSDAELTEICRSTNRPEKERLILRKRHMYPTHEEFKRKGTINARWQLQPPSTATSGISGSSGSMKDLPAISSHNATPTTQNSTWLPDKQMTLDIITGTHQSTLPTSPTSYQDTHNSSSSSSTTTRRPDSMYVPNPSSQHPDSTRNSMFKSRNHTRIKRFFGERPPSEVISSNLTSFFPNHKPDLLETAGINAKRLSTTRRNSAASRIDIRSSSRNSVLPELVSVLGVDMDKFVEEDEEDDDDDGDDDGESVEDNDDTDSNDGNSFHSDNDEHHDDDTRDTSLEQRNRPTSKLDNGEEDGDEDDEDDFKSAAEAFKEQHLNGDTDTDTTVISDSNNNNNNNNNSNINNSIHDDEKMSPEQQLISQQNRSTSLSYLNGSKQRDPPVESNGTVAKEMDTSSSLHSPTSPQPAITDGCGLPWMKGSLIGRGTFGDVYLGLNPFSGELMAVKQVELPVENSASVERKRSMVEALRREIALLQELQHENIVQYLGSQSDNAHFSIFLEYVPGGSVAGLLASYGAFQEPLVKSFVRQILKGLTYLHGKDIVHRDIKGANVLVDNKGGVKISDFGISKKVEDDIMQVASTASHRPSLQGSIFWMAPEVVKQTQYTRKADIWSLGCMVVEMFTGDHPFPEFSQMQAIFQIGSYTAPDIPEHISEDAKDFLKCTFQLDHEQRPTAHKLLSHPFLALGNGTSKHY
ncbi:hypothetical protein [Absidia glauca]|uniref:mitogen-activated protein kinase kinase kinase n=1 Tax=Absidia glauca TaxID=4829 RepID=A0A168RQB1_ABSGL|nr:hypothetical protein [Absidia glauca]